MDMKDRYNHMGNFFLQIIVGAVMSFLGNGGNFFFFGFLLMSQICDFVGTDPIRSFEFERADFVCFECDLHEVAFMYVSLYGRNTNTFEGTVR